MPKRDKSKAMKLLRNDLRLSKALGKPNRLGLYYTLARLKNSIRKK